MKPIFTLLLAMLLAHSSLAQSIDYTIPKEYRSAISKEDYKRLVDVSVREISAKYRISRVKSGTVELEKGQPLQVLNLHSLIAQCAAEADKAQWESLVQGHFDKLFTSLTRQAALDVQNFDTVARYLSLRIYPQAMVDQRGGPAGLVTRTDLEGTYTLLMLDLPGAFTPITRPMFAAWNKSSEEAFRIAQRNVNKQAIEKITKSFDFDKGSFEASFLGNADYAASYALDLAVNSPEMVGEWGSVVAIPNKGLVNLCKISPDKPLDFVQFIQRVRPLVEQSFAEHPQSVSNRFFWYYQNHFTPITVTTGSKGEAVIVAPLGLGTLMAAKK